MEGLSLCVLAVCEFPHPLTDAFLYQREKRKKIWAVNHSGSAPCSTHRCTTLAPPPAAHTDAPPQYSKVSIATEAAPSTMASSDLSSGTQTLTHCTRPQHLSQMPPILQLLCFQGYYHRGDYSTLPSSAASLRWSTGPWTTASVC